MISLSSAAGILSTNPTKLAFAALSLIVLTGFAFKWFAKDRVEIRFVILILFIAGVAAAVFMLDPPKEETFPTKEEAFETSSPLPNGENSEQFATPKSLPEIKPEREKLIAKADGNQKLFALPPKAYEKLSGKMVSVKKSDDYDCGVFVVPNKNPFQRSWKTARILCKDEVSWVFATSDKIDAGWLSPQETKGQKIIFPDWRDENEDGMKDYYRPVGDSPNIYESCLMAPDFSSETAPLDLFYTD